MLGIIPAAGEGKRLNKGCKALVELKGKPMIEHMFKHMLSIGIKKSIIIINGDEIEKKFGNLYEDMELLYVQQEERKGIAHAINLTKDLVDDSMCIMFADIFYKGDLKEMKGTFDLADSTLYGVQLVKNKELIKKSYGISENDEIIEKPENVENLKPVLGLGIYMAKKTLFEDIEKTPKNERTGEIEFTDTLNLIEKRNAYLLKGKYVNINTEEDLKNAEEIKILIKGHVFNPTGIATANREICCALHKLGIKVQTTDPWRDDWEFNEGLEHFNNPINCNKDTITIFADYPENWQHGYGKIYGFFLHEGTRLMPGWNQIINRVDKVFVPSEATKNLFKWNDVTIPIEIIPYGVNPEIYKPKDIEQTSEEKENFKFLSVNSWTGLEGDRKGTDLLIKAFDQEFKENEKVKLILKIGTFWQKGVDYMAHIINILGHVNPNILFNDKYATELELAEYYQKSDCFVAPTRGEAFGLTIINSLACGLPVIVTKDQNAGHMDFCKNKE